MTQGSSFRLPRTVTPSRYAIELRLDPAAPTFDGTVDVAVKVHEAVGEIVLNGTEITVHAGALVGADEQVVEIDKAVPDAAAGRLTLELPAVLATGEYSLRLEFSGRLSDLMEGMYRSRYTDDAGARARHHHDPLRGHRRPAQLPVLGRARSEGVVHADAGGPRGRDRAHEHARDRS